MRGLRSLHLCWCWRALPRCRRRTGRSARAAANQRARARRPGARGEEDQRALRSDLPQIHETVFRPGLRLALLQGAGIRRERTQADGDELGRCARRHAAHAVDVSGDRVAPPRVRRDRPARVEHRRRHHARSLSLATLGKDVADAERHHFMFASYNAGEGTIKRALASPRPKAGTGVVERRADRTDRPALAVLRDARLRAPNRFDVRQADASRFAP